MNRNSIYTRVLLVIISLVVIVVFINRKPHHTPGNTWLPSSFNPVGAGHMAFFQTLQEMNWPVERWRDPLSRLSTYGKGNVLIITRSGVGAPVLFSTQEIDLLDDWVNKGNTLLLLGSLDSWDDTRLLLEQLGFFLSAKKDAMADLFQPFGIHRISDIELKPANGSATVGTLIFPQSDPLPQTYLPHARVLWQLQGQPYVIDVPHGAGHVLCASSAQFLSNADLKKGDNLAIVLQWLAPMGHLPNHIFFEESHHGFSAIYAVARLLDHSGIQFAGLLTLLGAFAFLGSSLVRFGPIIPLQRESGRSTLEFVNSMADLYLRADLRNETMQSLFVETHQRVLQRLNLPPTASHELIASRLQQANPHLPKWKKLAQRFDSRDYMDGLPPTGWLRVARDLIEIKSAMA